MQPDYTLTLAGIWSTQAECFILFCAALGMAVHLVCTANFMPPGRAPAVLWLPVAIGAGACVIVMHSAAHGRVLPALWGMLVVACCLALFQVVLWLRGYHVCAHLQTAAADAPPATLATPPRNLPLAALVLGLVIVIALTSCAAPPLQAARPPLPVPITLTDAPIMAPVDQAVIDQAANADATPKTSPAVGTLAVPLVRRLAWSLLQFLANSSAVIDIKAGQP